MNDWNQLVRDSIEEFRKPKTVTIKIKQRKDFRPMLFWKIALALLVQAALFVCWLTDKSTSNYLVLSSLFAVGADLWLLYKAATF